MNPVFGPGRDKDRNGHESCSSAAVGMSSLVANMLLEWGVNDLRVPPSPPHLRGQTTLFDFLSFFVRDDQSISCLFCQPTLIQVSPHVEDV